MNVFLTGSYTVKPIQFGFKISINSTQSNDRLYKLILWDQDKKEKVETNHSVESFEILHLKPCTNYSHELSFTSGNSWVLCNHTGNVTSTSTLSE